MKKTLNSIEDYFVHNEKSVFILKIFKFVQNYLMKKFLFGFLFSLLLWSCARVGSPVGGAKDTIAPRFIGANIDTTRVNVPTNLKELRLYFDEYITLKEVQKNLIISPPIKLKKILPTMLGNKFVLLQWEQPLLENTTYSFNFGNSIQDLNEGNILPYFNFAFSTGKEIDNLYISGEIYDGMKRQQETAEASTNDKRNYVVGLYQEKDTMDYRQKPYYITKADPDGYFELNFLSPGKYRILAFNDENQNSIYDVGKESVSFLKEPVDLQTNISGKKFPLFPSKKPLKLVETKAAIGGLLMLFEGNPEEVNVQLLENKIKDYKVNHKPKSDSVHIYFDAKKENIGLNQNENIKLKYNADGKEGETSVFYRFNQKDEMALTNLMGNLIPPEREFQITSNYPLEKIQSDKWSLKTDSVTSDPFTAKIAENNTFRILINAQFESGKKYSLTVPRETVSSFYTSLTKTHQFNFEIDKAENYGSFILNLENKPAHPFWIQFLDEQGNVSLSRLTNDSKNSFTQIKPAKYQLRILVDNNENGFWDSVDLETLTFAEDVYNFPKVIEIRPLWENREVWNLKTNATETPIPKEEDD